MGNKEFYQFGPSTLRLSTSTSTCTCTAPRCAGGWLSGRPSRLAEVGQSDDQSSAASDNRPWRLPLPRRPACAVNRRPQIDAMALILSAMTYVHIETMGNAAANAERLKTSSPMLHNDFLIGYQ